MEQRRFSNQEIRKVRETFYEVIDRFPDLGLEMCVDGSPIIRGGRKAPGFFRFANARYGLELCPVYVKGKEPGCLYTLYDYINHDEGDTAILSCKERPLDDIFARLVGVVRLLTLAFTPRKQGNGAQPCAICPMD